MNKPVAEQFSTVAEFEAFYNKKRKQERRDMFAAAIVQGTLAAHYSRNVQDLFDEGFDLNAQVDRVIMHLDQNKESK